VGGQAAVARRDACVVAAIAGCTVRSHQHAQEGCWIATADAVPQVGEVTQVCEVTRVCE
jgi:hypothetical protein